MKTFLIGVAFAAGAVTADLDSFHASSAVPPQQHQALYSFVDVYRLTVAGPMGGLLAADGAQDAAIRVAQAQGSQAAEPRFTISSMPRPDKWLLLLAGLALAGWVAHRRLVHSL